MKPKERTLTAFQHREPDRVPLFEPWIESKILGGLGGDLYSVRERLGMDCLPLGWNPKRTRAYGNGIDEWGRIFKNGQYCGGLIRDRKDLEKYTPPLSHSADWFPQDRVKRIKEIYGDFALYFAWHDCTLGLSYLRMGMESFFIGLYERPDFTSEVLKNSTQWTISLVEQANLSGVDFIILGDDAADNAGTFLSPVMFREWVMPEYKRITAASDVPILWHSDGCIESLLPIIVDAGFSGVHSLEGKADVDLERVKRNHGKDLVLAGNIDCTVVLCQSNKDVVKRDVERCIRQGAHGGGYLFSSSNSLFEGHNLEAILEAYGHARKIGVYPIQI